jgi:hypothetical protein
MTDNHISVRGVRRKLPLTVTSKPKASWWWDKCDRCPHMSAVAIVPFVIRWGPDGWPDMVRQQG